LADADQFAVAPTIETDAHVEFELAAGTLQAPVDVTEIAPDPPPDAMLKVVGFTVYTQTEFCSLIMKPS
jgi:hypothetical protein